MRQCAVVVAVVVAGCSSPAPKTAARNEPAATAPVSVTQFYPTAPRIGKGEKVELCYSVENASAVKLEPPVEKVWPALTRCFEVHPAANTTYTLTATDSQGRSASKSTEIVVGAPKPAGAHIVEVTVNKLDVARGEQVVVCYNVRNAISVRITPGQATKESAERGCVTDKPSATTTYQVVATGAGGQTDSEHVTVKVH